jgi:molecular chaperone GrpE
MKDEEIKNKELETDTQEDLDNFEDVTFIESAEDGDLLPSKDIIRKLREELKNCKKEKEDYLVGWQRAKADYINLQKDYGESNIKNSIIVKEKFLRNLLPALDSFDVAFANKESWESVDKNWRMGMEYIYQQFVSGLLDSGIERIDKENILFDPFIHESVELITTDDKSKDHIISKIIQTGYKIGDKIIRPARVNVFEHKES